MGQETYLYGRGGGSGAYFLTFIAIVMAGGIVLAGAGADGLQVLGVQLRLGLATLCYLAIAGLGGWLAFGEVQSERFKTKSARPIALDAQAITAPAIPDSRRMVRVAFADITAVSVDSAAGPPWLHITHRGGKLAISAEAMESAAAFNRMLASVELRVMLAGRAGAGGTGARFSTGTF